jgi:hypothetical protein
MNARGRPLWTLRPSRFAALTRSRARLAWLALILILAASLTALGPPAIGSDAPATTIAADGVTDLGLYESVVAGLRGGDSYYVAASTAMRATRYPLRPFFTMRMPALAVIQAALPVWATPVLLVLLAGITALCWAVRIGGTLNGVLPRAVLVVALAASMLAFFQPGLVGFHEIWAGLLIALSLAIRRRGRWIEAVALGLAAMLIRETAMPYAVMMAAFAWFEGERRETMGWGVALLLFAVAFGLHGQAVAGVTGPLDAQSAGWAGLNGPGFFIHALVVSTALDALPLAVGALLAGLALIGWASWDDPAGARMFALLVGYGAAIAVFARTDTFYWALMIAPAALAGLVFVPDALRDLWRRALDRRRITVTTVVQ